MSERVKVNVKVSSEVNTILHDLFNQIQYELCEQYEEEIERLNKVIKEYDNWLDEQIDFFEDTGSQDNVCAIYSIAYCKLQEIKENK